MIVSAINLVALLATTLVAQRLQEPFPIFLRLVENRVVNGKPAAPGQFPHQISLYYNNQFMCGGSIISKTHVLTAAHCVVNQGTYAVKAGSIYVNQGDSHTVTTIRSHPRYNAQTISNDVAVLKVSPPFNFGSNIRAISFASQPSHEGAKVISSGWGLTNPNDPSSASQTLNYLELAVGSCPIPEPGKVCAKATHGAGVCSGDSGGPMITTDGKQLGVNSFVYMPCGQTSHPDGFANVLNYYQWIKENMV